ncbi:hypothetical protein SDC9_25113 [bioreactor metagenome]|uniref:DNA cytosine methyltransferase n=1 Tax=bioreactor metagenome TaxID=1076179 RepID=A0A644UJP2_9ZZZZ
MTALRVLIGCERSGIVRRAFAARGHEAWSCDLAPAEDGSNRHMVSDVREALGLGWDLAVICHPPCTRLANSGVRWLTAPPRNPPDEVTAAERAAWRGLDDATRLQIMWRLLDEGAALFSACWSAPVLRIAIENPVMHKHAKARIREFRPFAQSVQPWQFGTDPAGPDNVTKRTCLWLRGLPKLTATGTLDGSTARDEIHRAPPGPGRKVFRSRFFPGLAAAMAEQWGDHALEAISRIA